MATLTCHRSRPLRAGLVIGLLAVLLAGCGLFRPARPEIGAGGGGLLPDYSAPESCLLYMRVGIERKDSDGQNAYVGALANASQDGIGFHAFFDQAVWNAYTGVPPQDWDLRHETLFYSAFIRLTGDPYEMSWLPDEFNPHDDISGDTVVVHRRYEVRALRAATRDSLLIAVGYADLYFARISASRWALTRWMDRVDPNVGAQPADPLQQTFGSRRLNSGTGG
jgi:hypothetical protein